jgi:serine/threonine-protein kinase
VAGAAGAAGAATGRYGAPPQDPGAVPTAPAGRRPRRRLTGPLLALLALVAFVVVGALLAGNVLGPDDSVTPVPSRTAAAPTSTPPSTSPSPTSEPPSTTTTTSAPTTTTPEGIEVVAGDYVGRPKDDVLAELKDLGLKPEERKEKDTDAEKDTVLAVDEGTYDEGDTVTVVVADPPKDPGTPGKDKGEDN